jgi:hypothetical protein
VPENGISRNYFAKEKPVDQVHESVDCTGPVHHGRPREVAGARPPATLGLKVAREGAKDGELGSGNPLRASPEDGRR